MARPVACRKQRRKGLGDDELPGQRIEPGYYLVIVGRGDIIPAQAGGHNQPLGNLPLVLCVEPPPVHGLVGSGTADPGGVNIEIAEQETGWTESRRTRRCVLRGPVLGERRPRPPAVVERMDVVVHGAHTNGMVPDYLGKVGMVVKALQGTERHRELGDAVVAIRHAEIRTQGDPIPDWHSLGKIDCVDKRLPRGLVAHEEVGVGIPEMQVQDGRRAKQMGDTQPPPVANS